METGKQRATEQSGKPEVPKVTGPEVAECTARIILSRFGIPPVELAKYLGVSLVTIVRWERGDTFPDSRMQKKLTETLRRLAKGETLDVNAEVATHVFAARGARRGISHLPLFEETKDVEFDESPKATILSRLRQGEYWGNSHSELDEILAANINPAPTIEEPVAEGISAGKNTYTYDAHTYHTKVPPQGIAEVIKRYLPEGGVVLDPFAGSGMTGVAARTLGADVILNELSPAASFITDRFTRSCDPIAFASAVKIICNRLRDLRRTLYTTQCRECGRETEILYTVWSYRVRCSSCEHDFVLWDHCRHYGNTVREHKILSVFPCPSCNTLLKKSRLSRTFPEPVLVGYKCCTRRQVEHPLTEQDRRRIEKIDADPPVAAGFVPGTELPDGVNLCQPKRHGLMSVASFYTKRNLSAMSHLWREIHRLRDHELAGFLAFVFTSLYQRVTRLSEFRFWGGSGNTANFNVPYIFNESNVFLTFERKALTIQDHLETTVQSYSGRCVVHTGSATNLSFLPDSSVDLVFTDPPFGANINYSEMNILWESWLGTFTDPTDEAIVNRFQGKDVARYGELMTVSLRECYRVLKAGHWMVLVFMNSSEHVWRSLQGAVLQAGFSIERVDIFDKQHGTFKQFVSENTAGCDLLLHCHKGKLASPVTEYAAPRGAEESVRRFLEGRRAILPMLPFLHVQRQEEIDFRMLYSEFLATRLRENGKLMDFSSFRKAATYFLKQTGE